MDQMFRETDEAYQARMLLLLTEAKQRSDAVAAATKKKAEDAEKARLLAIEQQHLQDEAAAKAADEERLQHREKIFSGERALLTLAADWRAEAKNGNLEESGNKITLLLEHLTDLLATCIAQQEDIHNRDDAVQRHNQVFDQFTSHLQQLEQIAAAPVASSSNISDRLEALELDVGSLKDGIIFEHLRRVLETLCGAKYKANRDKCEFVRQELEYLGHFVTTEGISLLSDKIQAIQEWPEPRNVTAVRSFLGLAGYYERLIKGYSKIAAHLTKLQCEDRPFDFGEDARESFLALKAALLSAEVLSIYDPLSPTRVTMDASGYGVVLEQHDGVDWHPVEYFSKKVPIVHSIDDARKKELLDFVHALKRWRHFLLGRSQFQWVTNNNPLVFYKIQDTVNNTIARCMTFIDQFDFFPDHIPGKSNRFADALARCPDHCTVVYSTFEIDNDLWDSFIRGYQVDPEFWDKEAIAMDITCPFPKHKTGVDGILTVVDRLTKFAMFLPCRYHAKAPELAEVLYAGWIRTKGYPKEIVCDRDTRFISDFWLALIKRWGSSLKPSSARHAPTDGQTERAHQTALILLRTLIRPDQKDWVQRLPDIELAYNSSIHPVIGMSPFEFEHGSPVTSSLDTIIPRTAESNDHLLFLRRMQELLVKARDQMAKTKQRMSQQANRQRLPCPFRIGDLVWVSTA
ncbi:hypothetical protein CBR_g31472 [Chara braunii]|uniref:Integrase catalytic domain-containing protein n=1 Tax=Chara braunii TaxID=69332 RepID=A0A388LF38_CHABU|nr:hypothetical protein CBR_g31472 [Chara braunii]|eukprot:GBG80916.1 hypothetical protein CBR_g31472 [Chara braunii]